MNSKELYSSYETFTRLFNEATDEEPKARFKKLAEMFKVKFEDKLKEEHNKRKSELQVRLTKSGVVDFDAWLSWAKSLYKITMLSTEWRVESEARDWNEPMVWYFQYEIECYEKVEQLINYKIRDRKRGHGDQAKDLSKVG